MSDLEEIIKLLEEDKIEEIIHNGRLRDIFIQIITELKEEIIIGLNPEYDEEYEYELN